MPRTAPRNASAASSSPLSTRTSKPVRRLTSEVNDSWLAASRRALVPMTVTATAPYSRACCAKACTAAAAASMASSDRRPRPSTPRPRRGVAKFRQTGTMPLSPPVDGADAATSATSSRTEFVPMSIADHAAPSTSGRRNAAACHDPGLLYGNGGAERASPRRWGGGRRCKIANTVVARRGDCHAIRRRCTS